MNALSGDNLVTSQALDLQLSEPLAPIVQQQPDNCVPLTMRKQTSENSAFLSPSPIPRRTRRTAQAACTRPMSNRQPSSLVSSNRPPRVFANVRLNEIVEGVVARVASFGAFVEIGNGQTGLVHISEIAETFVQDINKHVSPGDRLSVKVISIDVAKNRIGLSIRQAVPTASGYQRVIELGGDWGHPWGDDRQTKFMDLGALPEPRPHHWEPDPSLFQRWDA